MVPLLIDAQVMMLGSTLFQTLQWQFTLIKELSPGFELQARNLSKFN